MLVIIYTSTGQVKERVGFGSTNQPELRAQLIKQWFEKNATYAKWVYCDQEISMTDLLDIHDRDYINFLQHVYNNWQVYQDPAWIDSSQGIIPNHFCKTKPNVAVPLYKHCGYYCGDYMTPVFEDTFKQASIAAQQCYLAALHAIGHLNTENHSVAYALVNTPGHHAKIAEYHGYCYFANAVIAARHFQQLGKARVAILDLDFHAGNGTAHIVENHNMITNMLACSIHIDPALDYPSFDGYTTENTHKVINYPMVAGTSRDNYQCVLSKALVDINAFKADALVIAFGGDTYKHDPDASPMAKFNLDIADYAAMGAQIKQCVAKDVPIVITQEGGYNMDHIAEIVGTFVSGLVQTMAN